MGSRLPLKAPAKALFGRLLDEYRLNWIVASPAADHDFLPGGLTVRALDEEARQALRTSTTPKVRGSLKYSEAGFEGLALADGDALLSVAHFATPANYDRHGTWPLRAGETALVDIVTEEAARGHGHAATLIRAATAHYRLRGGGRLIAYIWWTNHPSLRAFRNAGWRRIGFSIEWRVAGRWRSLRIHLRRR